MYPDKSLLPREAIRLAALGLLAIGPRSYAALASEVRHFVSLMAGPSLELMGPSIELLRHEGLIAPHRSGEDAHAALGLTDAGHAELDSLLRSAVRTPLTDINRLVLALKLRFLDLLAPDARRVQIAMIAECYEGELARLLQLRAHHAPGTNSLGQWLDIEIGAVEGRLAWLNSLE